MSTAIKTLIRDRLVNDSSLRTLLNATATGSATVYPSFMELSGIYPSVIYRITEAGSDPGMSGTNGFVSFNINVQATGSQNPHIRYANIQTRIEQLFDDQSVTGTDISGTSVYGYLFLREGGLPVVYDQDRKVYTKVLNISFKVADR